MKFLAILRDSVREALDYKVIYFLFALSAVVILVVASVSYRPEPGEKGLQDIFNRMPGRRPPTSPLDPMGPPLVYEVEDFQQVDESKPVWESEFRYTLVVRELSPPKADEDDDEKDDAKDKKDKEAKKGKKPRDKKAEDAVSSLRYWVFMDLLRKKPDERSPEDVAMIARLEKVDRELKKKLDEAAKKGGGKGAQRAVQEALLEALREGSELVTASQMSEFLKTNLAASGTLDVSRMKLKEEKDRTFRFEVEAKARPETIRTWPHTPVLFFGAVKVPMPTGIAPWVQGIETWVVTGMGAGLTLLLSTVITAFFIPNMMRKGTIDLLISKPVHRWYLLLCKYIGGLSFMFFSTVVIVVGIWLVLGLRTGLWSMGFLLGIVTLTIQFAILYAVSTLTGVFWRSPIISILAACAWWFVLYGVGTAYLVTDQIREAEMLPAWVHTTVDTAHAVLPRYKDFDILAAQAISNDLLPSDNPQRVETNRLAKSINWWASIGVTAGFIALLLAWASWRFSVKDY